MQERASLNQEMRSPRERYSILDEKFPGEISTTIPRFGAGPHHVTTSPWEMGCIITEVGFNHLEARFTKEERVSLSRRRLRYLEDGDYHATRKTGS